MKKSDTLVVLGNGPSLKGFDFRRLRRFDAIGMNAAYRYWDQINWYPNFYICLDTVVGISHQEEIARLIRESEKNGIKVFVLRRNLIDVLPAEIIRQAAVLDFDSLRKSLPIYSSARVITTGSHAALTGAMFGYRQLILLGVDCDYVERIETSVAIDAGGANKKRKQPQVLEIERTPQENPNYFFDGYQVVGDKYHLPNPTPDLHVNAWRTAAEVLARYQVKAWNGNPNSQVDAFPFLEFSELEKRESRMRRWWSSLRKSPVEGDCAERQTENNSTRRAS